MYILCVRKKRTISSTQFLQDIFRIFNKHSQNLLELNEM